MTARISRRIAITTGAAALCIGVAVPASAHMIGDEHQSGTVVQHRHKTLTLAQRKAFATKALDREADYLNAAKAKVASDDKLTSGQKAELTAKIDKALDAVFAAKAKVADAMTAAEVEDAVHEGFASSHPQFGTNWRHQLSFDEQQAAAIAWLTRKADWLNALKTKVTADDKLTDVQKADYIAKVDKAIDVVGAAKDAVSNATTTKELRAALAKAHLAPGAFPRTHHRHQHGAKDSAKTDSGKTNQGADAVTATKVKSDRKSVTLHHGCRHGDGAFGRHNGFDPDRHHHGSGDGSDGRGAGGRGVAGFAGNGGHDGGRGSGGHRGHY